MLSFDMNIRKLGPLIQKHVVLLFCMDLQRLEKGYKPKLTEENHCFSHLGNGTKYRILVAGHVSPRKGPKGWTIRVVFRPRS